MSDGIERDWHPTGEYRLKKTPFGEYILQQQYTATYVDRIDYYDEDSNNRSGLFVSHHKKGDVKTQHTKTDTEWRSQRTIIES